MKKIISIFSIFITLTAAAQDRVQYDKAASDKFKDGESKIQIYLSEGAELLYEKFDTVRTYKNGHPIETITDNSVTVVIRDKEFGKVSSWTNDTILVSFDTKNSGIMTLPFKADAGGKNNTLKLCLDQECSFYPGRGQQCKTLKQVTLQERKFKVVSGIGSYLEYEPKLKGKQNKEKIVSHGHKVK